MVEREIGSLKKWDALELLSDLDIISLHPSYNLYSVLLLHLAIK